MNLYRYRVIERTTIAKRPNKTTSSVYYHLQRSVLGIMWTDMESFRRPDDAIFAYNEKIKKVEYQQKVIHPVKETP